MTKQYSQADIDALFGPEPVFISDKELSESDVTREAYWYRETQSDATKKKWFLEYIKSICTESEYEGFKTVDDYRFSVMGTWARMVSRGAILPKKYIEAIENFPEKIKEFVNHDVVAKKENSDRKKVNVQEHIRNSVNKYAGSIEFEIDKFIENDFKSEFSMMNFLEKNEIKGLIAKRIGESLIPQQKELEELLSGWNTDNDLRESWSSFTKPQIKKFDEFISLMIEDCNKLSENKKRSAKPRKHKSPDLQKIIAKVQYLEHDSKLKLESLHPIKIIKADEVWVWNQKLRKLGVYYSKNADGLSIKGTTIQNFNEDSVSKTIRKPEEYFKKILNGGKRVLKKEFVGVKAKEQKLKGRLNKDTLIVKVF